MAYKITVDKEKCAGCGACTQCDNFEMQDDGKAHAKKSEVEEIGCNQEAAEVCPVDAIIIKEQ